MTDWAQLKRLAYGPLGLKPNEFWALTPAEMSDMMDGYKLRTEWEMERLAWHAANVMNVHLKKKITIKKLLGKEKKAQSKEDKMREIEKLKKIMQQLKGGQM